MGSNPIQVAKLKIRLRYDFVLVPPLRRRVLRTHYVRLEDFKSYDLKPCKGLGTNPIQVANFLWADVAQLVEQLTCNQ